MTYQCPLCSEELVQNNRLYRCSNNHQFDIAKEGYVNLIPANKKRSKNPGDNTEMMQARRRFLEGGHYAQLSNRIGQLSSETLSAKQNVILDIGCGEGYYTQVLKGHLNDAGHLSELYGLDISKVAIRYAAKKYPDCRFSVASSQRLPFSDRSLDMILRIYAPCNPEEMVRCVAKNGIVITVTPASRHLYQLRELIYDEVRLHSEEVEEFEGFVLEKSEKLSYQMALKGTEALDLLQMTPFAWKASIEMKENLANSAQFSCEADFVIRVYRKR